MSDIAARNRRNRAAGKRFEAELRDGFRAERFDIERTRDTGKDDEGDLVIREVVDGRTTYIVIEAKNAKFEPTVFVREAQVERDNFAKHRGLDPSLVDGIAIIKRRGQNWRKAFVLTTVEDYFDLPSDS